MVPCWPRPQPPCVVRPSFDYLTVTPTALEPVIPTARRTSAKIRCQLTSFCNLIFRYKAREAFGLVQ